MIHLTNGELAFGVAALIWVTVVAAIGTVNSVRAWRKR